MKSPSVISQHADTAFEWMAVVVTLFTIGYLGWQLWIR